MYTLYFLPNACSLATQVLLRELGQEFELVHRSHAEHYETINPVGAVPALIDGEQIICEGAAIIGQLSAVRYRRKDRLRSRRIAMATNREALHTITEILTRYFDGLHHGDTAKLRALFHNDTILKAPGLRRTLDEWLHAVDTRPVPAHEGHAYRFRILSIEIVEDLAMAKVECPLFEHFYIDYLGLLQEEGRWRIVSKMYTDVANRPI